MTRLTSDDWDVLRGLFWRWSVVGAILGLALCGVLLAVWPVRAATPPPAEVEPEPLHLIESAQSAQGTWS